MRRLGGGDVCWLVALVLLGGGVARGEEPSQLVSSGGREAPATASPPLAGADTVNGIRFVWPDLDGGAYADAEAAPWRRALGRWRDGVPRGPHPSHADSPAALFLAADLAFVEASAGQAEWLAVSDAYEKALRAGPDFPDAVRAWFLLGETNLRLGFGPEATAAFQRVTRDHPSNPLALEAKLGEAAALRVRHRVADAKPLLDAVLDAASGGLRCRALEEAIAESRVTGPAADVAAGAHRLATTCPDALDRADELADYAEALAAAGEVDAARAALAERRDPRAPGAAKLRLLEGTLALQAGDREAARLAYEGVLGLPAPEAVVADARVALARLDAAAHPDRAVAALTDLAARTRSVPVRAATLAAAADTAAAAGRWDEALALVAQSAELGHEAAREAETRRRDVLSRWIAALDAADDPASLVTVYAAYTTTLEELATPEDAQVVARALATFGLDESAARLLTLVAQRTGEPPVLEAFRAEETLAAGDATGARSIATRLLAGAPAADVARRARGVLARAALSAGDAAGAASVATAGVDGAVRAEVARALVAAGDAASARALVAPALATNDAPTALLLAAGDAAAAAGAWDAASDAYGRAFAVGGGPAHAEAAAGLVRAALARGDTSVGARLLGTAKADAASVATGAGGKP